jgi:PII-like signaling protein
MAGDAEPYSMRRGLGQEAALRLEETGKRLTIYCGEYDRYRHHSLAKVLVERAREEGLAGATMLRGIEGFGATRRLHTSRIVSLSDDLPVVIQIVDEADRIAAFMPIVDELLTEGLVTLEDVDISFYRGRHPHALDDDEPVGG